MSYNKYQRLVHQVSTDGGRTWTTAVPVQYARGELIERNSLDCQPSYRWVVISDEFICAGTEGFDKYEKLKKQVSIDGGTTWTDVVPLETQAGNLIQRNSVDCGAEPEYKWEVDHNRIVCDGTTAYYALVEYVSYDNRATWTETGNVQKSTVVYQENYPDCIQTVYRWIDTGNYVCVGTSKYAEQKQQVSYNSGTTWQDTGSTRAGSLIEANSVDCGATNVEWVNVEGVICESGTFIERWIVVGTACDGEALVELKRRQISIDNGSTWVDTVDTEYGSTIVLHSLDCGAEYTSDDLMGLTVTTELLNASQALYFINGLYYYDDPVIGTTERDKVVTMGRYYQDFSSTNGEYSNVTTIDVRQKCQTISDAMAVRSGRPGQYPNVTKIIASGVEFYANTSSAGPAPLSNMVANHPVEVDFQYNSLHYTSGLTGGSTGNSVYNIYISNDTLSFNPILPKNYNNTWSQNLLKNIRMNFAGTRYIDFSGLYYNNPSGTTYSVTLRTIEGYPHIKEIVMPRIVSAYVVPVTIYEGFSSTTYLPEKIIVHSSNYVLYSNYYSGQDIEILTYDITTDTENSVWSVVINGTVNGNYPSDRRMRYCSGHMLVNDPNPNVQV